MEEILIFGHKNPDTDSICSALVKANLETKLGRKVKAARLGNVSKETQYILDYVGVEAPEFVSNIENGTEVMLVDHNEFDQSADNIENLKIISVTDHHRISNFHTTEPLYYNAKPYGCTNTLLFEEYKANGVEIDSKIATLMISAIISDTLLLKSPTCTEHDVEAFNELEKIVGFNAREYGMKMLKAGTDLSTYSATEVVNLDAKEFTEKGKKFVVAQVNTADIDDVFSRKEELAFAMEKEINDKGLELFLFVITDIVNTNSKIIAMGNLKGLVEKAFNKKLDADDSMFLEGVMSRKKQIAPPLLANLD